MACLGRSIPKKPTICGSLVYDKSAQGTLQLHCARDAPVEGCSRILRDGGRGKNTQDAVPEFKLNSNCAAGRTS